MVPAKQIHKEIDERLAAGQTLTDRPVSNESLLTQLRNDFATWTEYNVALLRRSFDQVGPAEQYWHNAPRVFSIGGAPEPLNVRLEETRAKIRDRMRRLSSLQERLPLFLLHPESTSGLAPLQDDKKIFGADVFIVHGHDGEAKVTIARFLSKLLRSEPIILHEQPDRGRTVIEKFEDHAATVGAAIVLLTADDEGCAVGQAAQPRARQNVVLELGFFLGKLGRGRVSILYEPGVELPSDLSGILYIELDQRGSWRNAIARELQAAGLTVDLAALLT